MELGTRVRISTSSKAIEQPTGIAGTGEVEDFKTQITHPPVGEKKTTEGLVKENRFILQHVVKLHMTSILILQSIRIHHRYILIIRQVKRLHYQQMELTL